MTNTLYKHVIDKHIIPRDPQDVSLESPFARTPIEKIEDEGSKTFIKLQRLKRETHWIKILVTLDPFGLNARTYEPKFKSKKDNFTPYVVPFSKTGAKSSKIVNKHFEELKAKNNFDFDFKIMTAYSKHNNLKDLLITSKLHN